MTHPQRLPTDASRWGQSAWCERTTGGRDGRRLARSPAEPCPGSSRTTAAPSLSSLPSQLLWPSAGGWAGTQAPCSCSWRLWDTERGEGECPAQALSVGRAWVRAASRQDPPWHRVWVAFLPKAPGSTREGAVSPPLMLTQRVPPGNGCSRGAPQGAQAFLSAGLWLLLYFTGFVCHFTAGTETPREVQLRAQDQLPPSGGRGGAGLGRALPVRAPAGQQGPPVSLPASLSAGTAPRSLL